MTNRNNETCRRSKTNKRSKMEKTCRISRIGRISGVNRMGATDGMSGSSRVGRADKAGAKSVGTRMLALMTAVLISVIMIPTFAFAEGEPGTEPGSGGGSGTEIGTETGGETGDGTGSGTETGGETEITLTQDPIQTRSSSTATIYVGKELSVSQDGKFPYITDFRFELEPVQAWKNSNSNGASNGSSIAASLMPRPTPVDTNHAKVENLDTGKTRIEVGNFATTFNDQTEGRVDTATVKYRSTPVRIQFSQAGYYVYRLTEIMPTSALIPGMTYDDHSYYVVFYVCNNTDTSGNTQSGVYVHDITSYRNDNSGTDRMPTLTDISSIPDNGNAAALANNPVNLGKVGISSDTTGTDPVTKHPIGPNYLEAFTFFNIHTTRDLVITTNVTGNLGDLSKQFEYKVILSGLEKNKEYSSDVPAQGKSTDNVTSQEAAIEELTGNEAKGVPIPSAKKIRSDANGEASFLLKMKDDEVFVLNALPAGATYTITELASDHVASFTTESTADSPVMVKSQDANSLNNTQLATAQETVNAGTQEDGTVTIKFSNHKDLATTTGIPYHGDWVYAVALMILMAAAFAAFRTISSRNARRRAA